MSLVERIYTEWYRYQDEKDKQLLRVYICNNDSIYSLDCSEETVTIREENDLPEGYVNIDNMYTYWLKKKPSNG